MKAALSKQEVLLKAPREKQVKEMVESWERKEETHPGGHLHHLGPSPIFDFRTTRQSTTVFCNSLIVGAAF